MIFTKLFVFFVAKNYLNAFFGPNEYIFSVKNYNLYLKKKESKDVVFGKRIGEIRKFLSFYVKISQNCLKFLGCPQNFGFITLKKCKNVTKKLIFTKLFARFLVKNYLNAIFGANKYIFSVKIIIFFKKYKKNVVFLKHIGKILRFLSFDVKISQYWLKFLGCPQNFGVLNLKI